MKHKTWKYYSELRKDYRRFLRRQGLLGGLDNYEYLDTLSEFLYVLFIFSSQQYKRIIQKFNKATNNTYLPGGRYYEFQITPMSPINIIRISSLFTETIYQYNYAGDILYISRAGYKYRIAFGRK